MTYLKDKQPETEAPKPASHDTQAPAKLIEFMLKDWAPRTDAVVPVDRADAFHARRRQVSKMFPHELLVIPTGHEKVRANDTHFRFRPCSDFYYLTGNLEPDCVLVMTPRLDGGHDDVLFVEPNPGRSNATFYTDRFKGELWVGPRLGVAQSKVRFGTDECRGLDELARFLEERKAAAPTRVLRGYDDVVDHAIAPRVAEDKVFATALSEMRLLKDALELAELATVIISTKRGFEDVIRALPQRHQTERHVEGVFNLRARVEGNDVGYNTIAASGAHACILHWTRNDGDLRPGDLLLLDAGVEGNSLYTADITRTLPLSGRFTPAQRAIYDLVHEAQAAAFAAVRPGNDFMEPNRQAMHVLAHGLQRLGILPDAEDALRDEHQFYKRYSLHNVSHMLGIDVHDCAQARQEVYKFGKLQPGMVLTVEPGLYFQVDDLTVPEEYRGIGVRIEDDVVVTEDGMRNLSIDIPSRSGDVEKWMAKLWGSKAAAKPAKKKPVAKPKTKPKAKAKAAKPKKPAAKPKKKRR
jgi:Xaa-Pro aminopeptidase